MAKEVRKINIFEFNNQFNKEYEFLYNAHKEGKCVAGYDEAVQEFDKLLLVQGKFVGEFCRFRGDLISSDREAAAFMFAMESMGLLQ